MTTIHETKAFGEALHFLQEEKLWISTQIANHFNFSADTCNILDLGSHRGELVKLYLEKIRLKHSCKFKVTCVEIDKFAVEHFLPKNEFGASIEIDIIQSDLEIFLEKNCDQFDLIVASHSLYWVKDLSKIVDILLKKAHKILVIMRGESGTCQIQKQLKMFMPNQSDIFYTYNTLENLLLEKKIPYSMATFETKIRIPKEKLPFEVLTGFILQQPSTSLKGDALQAFRNYLGNTTLLKEPNGFFCIEGSQR